MTDEEREAMLQRPDGRAAIWKGHIDTLDQKYGPDVEDAYIKACIEVGAESIAKVPGEDRKAFIEFVHQYFSE